MGPTRGGGTAPNTETSRGGSLAGPPLPMARPNGLVATRASMSVAPCAATDATRCAKTMPTPLAPRNISGAAIAHADASPWRPATNSLIMANHAHSTLPLCNPSYPRFPHEFALKPNTKIKKSKPLFFTLTADTQCYSSKKIECYFHPYQKVQFKRRDRLPSSITPTDYDAIHTR